MCQCERERTGVLVRPQGYGSTVRRVRNGVLLVHNGPAASCTRADRRIEGATRTAGEGPGGPVHGREPPGGPWPGGARSGSGLTCGRGRAATPPRTPFGPRPSPTVFQVPDRSARCGDHFECTAPNTGVPPPSSPGVQRRRSLPPETALEQLWDVSRIGPGLTRASQSARPMRCGQCHET